MAKVTKNPTFLNKTGATLAKRLAPHNIAASAVVAVLTGAAAAASGYVWQTTVTPRMQRRKILQSLEEGKSFAQIEAEVVQEGWAQTDNGAQALVFSVLAKEGRLIPARYGRFVQSPSKASAPVAQA